MTPEDTALVLVDVQGKLAEVMHERERLYDGLGRLTRGCRTLAIPVVWMEQIPEKMGPTIACLRELLGGESPIAKCCFSCWNEPAFVRRVETLGRRHILVAGIETHVCVYQTAVDMKLQGYAVQVVVDAVSSRTAENKAVGLERIRACGAALTSVETALFELIRSAGHPAFREILRIVK